MLQCEEDCRRSKKRKTLQTLIRYNKTHYALILQLAVALICTANCPIKSKSFTSVSARSLTGWGDQAGWTIWRRTIRSPSFWCHSTKGFPQRLVDIHALQTMPEATERRSGFWEDESHPGNFGANCSAYCLLQACCGRSTVNVYCVTIPESKLRSSLNLNYRKWNIIWMCLAFDVFLWSFQVLFNPLFYLYSIFKA